MCWLGMMQFIRVWWDLPLPAPTIPWPRQTCHIWSLHNVGTTYFHWCRKILDLVFVVADPDLCLRPSLGCVTHYRVHWQKHTDTLGVWGVCGLSVTLWASARSGCVPSYYMALNFIQTDLQWMSLLCSSCPSLLSQLCCECPQCTNGRTPVMSTSVSMVSLNSFV